MPDIYNKSDKAGLTYILDGFVKPEDTKFWRDQLEKNAPAQIEKPSSYIVRMVHQALNKKQNKDGKMRTRGTRKTSRGEADIFFDEDEWDVVEDETQVVDSEDPFRPDGRGEGSARYLPGGPIPKKYYPIKIDGLIRSTPLWGDLQSKPVRRLPAYKDATNLSLHSRDQH